MVKDKEVDRGVHHAFFYSSFGDLLQKRRHVTYHHKILKYSLPDLTELYTRSEKYTLFTSNVLHNVSLADTESCDTVGTQEAKYIECRPCLPFDILLNKTFPAG
jgi:hypothetical protein